MDFRRMYQYITKNEELTEIDFRGVIAEVRKNESKIYCYFW